MPNYNVLTWNIWQTGYKDYGAPSTTYPRLVNVYNFLNYTAGVIVASGANVVVLQEIYNQAGEVVLFSLCEALRAMTGRDDWFYLPPITAATGGNSECYGFLWRAGYGFAPVVDAAKPQPLAGSLCTTNALSGLASNDFPTNTGVYARATARRASYAVFSDNNGASGNVFITNYHAPSQLPGALEGLDAVAAIPELQGYNGNAYAAVILCGDYNVNMFANGAQAEYQARLTTPTGTVPSVMAYTSLCTNNATIAAQQPAASATYMSSAYDNIFVSNAVCPGNTGRVLPLLDENMATLLPLSCAYILQSNGRPTFQYADNITMPIDTTYKSFILTRYAISDHLPVNVSINVN